MITELVYNLFSVLLQVIVMDMIFEGRGKVNKKPVLAVYSLIWSLAIFVAGKGWLIVSRKFYAYVGVFLLFELIYAFVLHKGNVLYRFVTVMAGWISCFFAKAVITTITTDSSMVYIFSLLLEVLIAVFIYRFRLDTSEKLSVRNSKYMLVSCVLMFFITTFGVYNLLENMDPVAIAYGNSIAGWRNTSFFIMVELFMYFLISSISKEYSEKIYNSISCEKQSHEEELRRLHAMNHEIKNKAFYIKELVSEGMYDELKDYLSKQVEFTTGENDESYTGNKIIDDIISLKKESAEKKNIRFEIAARCLPDRIGNEADITSVMFNLLDNAIEASEKIDRSKAYVKTDIKPIKGYLSIAIANAVDSDVLRNNPDMLTTKSDSEAHGYGLEIVKNIVQKNNGMMDLISEDSRFEVRIMLPSVVQ